MYFVQASGGAVYARWDASRPSSELVEAVSRVFLSDRPVSCDKKSRNRICMNQIICTLQLPVVASTSQIKPDLPLEEDDKVYKADSAMEEKKEAAKPEESRLSGGGAVNTKKERVSQSSQQTTRHVSPDIFLTCKGSNFKMLSFPQFPGPIVGCADPVPVPRRPHPGRHLRAHRPPPAALRLCRRGTDCSTIV